MSALQILQSEGEGDLFALHAARPDDYPFLLESRQHTAGIGRFSLLLGEPDGTRHWACHRPEQLPQWLERLPLPDAVAGHAAHADLPFIGGWFVYLAYEAALGLQPHLTAPVNGNDELVALAVYCGGAIIVDHLRVQTWFVSECGRAADHRRALQQAPRPAQAGPSRGWTFRAENPDRFKAAVTRTVDYILAGDIYQANLSRRWQGPAVEPAAMLDAYACLRSANPACFAASVQTEPLRLASASPERLFSIVDGVIETRPIAGTRPRGASAQEDRALSRELLDNAKEQAEHIMLVDLERNDLGRICAAHSVEVDELLGLESYATVHHIVSNVRGQLRSDIDLRELLSAVFPGGTITGCPKLRCMQIITELEGRCRGAYTGSLGYISNHGRMDLNILIRTLAFSQGRMQFDAGAGIVADSKPAAELAETEAKAAGLMRALT